MSIDIAIVGMGCRLPGGVQSPQQYWRFLTGRGDGIVEVPAERWNTDLFYDPDPDAPGRSYTRHGGFLADSPWEFDPEFFGIAPREAMVMDPQQRLVLEVAWEAFDDAGMAGRIGGTEVGVYVGGFMTDNQTRRHLPEGRIAIDGHSATSGTLTMLSNRLSYALDLRGPSMTIDTACSSSLVAMHEAAQALVHGECAVAIAGGVNVMLHPETFVSMCKGRFLSADGRCKSFDAAADGYGRGEGAGMVVLKPAGAARRDGDRIYAVIRGSGVNQDGRTAGITVPNPRAQRALALRVCAAAGIDPGQVGYVEAHGTGTAVGDPVEMSALGGAFGTAAGRPAPLVVGSVKAAIGHLEAAAGVAGVIKAALTVHFRTIAPQAWLRDLNPAIPFGELNLRVPTEVEPFPEGYERITVAVNGFGYGGTNAHLILQEAPEGPQPPDRKPANVLPLSGGSEHAVRELAGAMGATVSAAPDIGMVCDAAWTRRAHHAHRAAVAYADRHDLAAKLDELAGGAGEVERAVVPPGTLPVFVFSGMGPQWWRMGRELLLAGGPFAGKAAEIDAVFQGIGGWSIVAELLADEGSSRMARAEVAQPANFLLQVSLAAELEAAGVRPAALAGHSVGEVSAAFLGGALSLRDALLVSHHRARLQATRAGSGGMLAVALPEQEAQGWINGHGEVSVAAVNSAASVTLAGPAEALDELRAALVAGGVFVRPLRVDVPYHSALMDPILAELETVLGDVRPSGRASPPTYSTVTGARIQGGWADAGYWLDNVRKPVRFAAAVTAMIEDGFRVFLEVGPHPVLSGNIREMLVHAGETGAAIPTLRRDDDDFARLNEAIGRLYTVGCLGAEAPGTGGGIAAHVDLPGYPWQRTRLISEPPAVALQRTGTPDSRPLLGERAEGGAAQWQTELSTARSPWLREHVVDGLVLLPAAAYLDALLSAAAERTGHPSLVVESVRFATPLVVDEHDIPALRLSVAEATNRVTIASRPAGGLEWTVNCTGRIVDAPAPAPRPRDLPRSGGGAITGAEFYARLEARGLRYGPAFRRIVEARGEPGTVVATISPLPDEGSRHLVHPCVVDAALQAAVALDDLPPGPLVPSKVGGVRWYAPVGQGPVTAVVRRRPGPGVRVDITLTGPDGQLLLELIDAEFAEAAPPVPAIEELDRLFYEVEWRPHEILTERLADPSVVVALGEQAKAPAGPRCVSPAEVASALRETGTSGVTVLVVAGQGDPVELVAGLVTIAEGIQEVLDESDGAGARAVVVTEGAVRLPGDRHEPNLAHAALVGARRSLRNEQPAARWSLIDLEPGSDPGTALPAEDAADGTDEICLRRGTGFVPYVRRTLAERLRPYAESAPLTDPAGSFEVEVPRSKLFADLALRSAGRTAPGPGEVEVRMDALGLNYKDTMKILGVLTEENLRDTYFGTSVGMEGFGVVTRAGAGCGLEPGDRVLVCVRNMFRRHVTAAVEAGIFARAPRGAGPAHGASFLPLLTAHYGLTRAARLTAGETVLVHGAAGGTGLAAVQVARALGARVIGSAGTAERRAFARRAGAHATVGSRSAGFVDEVLELTGGHGVDVVFTSLPGEALRQNLKVAAEFGRIVEIGKTDIYRGGAIELGPFDRNLSFLAVDMDRMFALRTELVRTVAGEMIDLLDKGVYEPLPATTYEITELAAACEAVARSSHTGRVLVSLDGSPPVRPRRPGFAVREAATYLITGGFGAFGLAMADWLVAQGARHLVLTGRRGAATPDARDRLRGWRARGVDVREERVDVADPAAVRELVRRTAETMPPLRGVFHAAGVLDDRPLGEVTEDSLRRVIEPKVQGAWNLHTALDAQAIELDAFVLCSSVSALIGLVSQIGYAAANSALDALAVLRRTQGKPALSVGWGALSGGMAEVTAQVQRYVDLIGVRPVALDRATALLQEILSLGGQVTEPAVVDIDWNAWALANPASGPSTRFAGLVTAAGERGADVRTLRGELAALPPDQRGEVLTFILAEQLALVLGGSAGDLDHQTPLPELGLDSLLAVELTARISGALGVQVSALEFSRGTGLAAIARRMAAGMEVA